jgi:hypothetical protein
VVGRNAKYELLERRIRELERENENLRRQLRQESPSPFLRLDGLIKQPPPRVG